MLIACELVPARTEKKFGERETQEFGERSDQGGSDRPSLRWGSPEACTQSILQRTAQKCTKNYNARTKPLFCSFNLLFSDVSNAVLVHTTPERFENTTITGHFEFVKTSGLS